MDVDCEHVWRLTEVHADASGVRMVHVCERCGATAWEPSERD